MAAESETTLFVSHHSSKLKVALELEEALAKYGVKCWLAPRDVEPGEAFDMAIKRAIDNSSGILLLFCSKSDKSPHVKRELILADSSHKVILPMRLEDIDPDELAYHLASFQWIDWLDEREGTIERVAAKAHQLSGSTNKTMSVDELVERSGHGAPAKQVSNKPTPPVSPDSQPIHDASANGSKTNWALIVAIAALLVAALATWLIWDSLRGDSSSDIVPTEAGELAGVDNGEPKTPVIEEPVVPVAAPKEPEVAPLPPSPKIRPSFNCNKASFRVEFLICGSEELADLDRALDSAYKRAMAIVESDALLKREQINWRVEIRDICADADCVSATMRERIAALKEIVALSEY